MTCRMDEYEPFVKAVTPRLVRHAYGLCGDAQLAQDLVQEALLRVFRNWDRMDMDRNPAAYAFQTVHNLHVSRMERRATSEIPMDALQHAGWTTGPDEEVQLKMEVARVLSFLRRRGPCSSPAISTT